MLRITPIAQSPHTQYRAKYRAASPGAGKRVAHPNIAVTKRARVVEARKSALLARLRRPQASQPTKIPATPRAFASIKRMLAGMTTRLRERFFAGLQTRLRR